MYTGSFYYLVKLNSSENADNSFANLNTAASNDLCRRLALARVASVIGFICKRILKAIKIYG